jgi:hypothetical protein
MCGIYKGSTRVCCIPQKHYHLSLRHSSLGIVNHSRALVAHGYNPSYLGGKYQEDCYLARHW